MALSNYQMQVGTGLVMGPGTPFLIDNVQGLGQPDRRTGDQARPLADGEFFGSDFYAGRQLVIDLTVVGSSAAGGGTPSTDRAAQAVANLSALSLAWRGDQTLYVALPGWTTARTVVGRCRRLKSDDRQAVKVGRIPVSLEFYSPYPAMFSPLATVGAAPGVLGGMVLPSALPWGFGVANSGLTCTVTNSGDYNYAPVLRLHGPFTNGAVTRSSDGATFGLSLPGPLSSADYVVVDNDARTVVKHSDGSNLRRYLTAGSSWLSFPPGTDTLTLSTDYGATGPYIEADTRSAWLA